MVVNGRPLKRMKTRVTADLNDFLTFPNSSNELFGPFRSNVRVFLSKHARPPPSFLNPQLWQVFFRIGDLTDPRDSSLPQIVTLDIIEEDVARSRSVYCDQCRVVGWSGHPVCAKRYHFIIRRDHSSNELAYQKPCSNCGSLLHLSDFKCKSCNYMLTVLDLQEWIYLQLEDTTHLLHGVVHSNGYGHLLRVNGREGGSNFLSGCDIMSFWDRLCKTLGARKISVMDVSKKYGLEYRLLHAITSGHPWYGDWGFEFGTGSFALTLEAYRKAVDCLSEIPLSLFYQARTPRTRLQDVITFYQALSECRLLTIKDLFCFLMGLIHKTKQLQITSKGKNYETCSLVMCTWTREDILRVQQSMIKVLQVAGGSCWVPWRALKGAACRLGSSELLDYCLKVLGGKVLDDGRMVLSRCNPELDAIEYRLVSRNELSSILSMDGFNCPSKEHLLRDLRFLYDALLNPQTMMSYRPKTTREDAICSAIKLLDCKQFIKDYESARGAMTSPYVLTLLCQVELIGHPAEYTEPPPEPVFLPVNKTVAELKIEVAKAFQEVYLLFKSFQVEELPGYGQVDDSSQVKLLIGYTGSVRVRGRFLSLCGLDHFRMERGTEIWTVSCKCGAKDDDGERMLACDICGTWQHTRCAGISDLQPVPERFICCKCKSIKQTTKHTKSDGKLHSGKKLILYDGTDAKMGSHSNNKSCSKYKDKPLAFSNIGPLPCRTDTKCEDNTLDAVRPYLTKIESPTISGTSSISNCRDEVLDGTSFLMMEPPCRFGNVRNCKFENQATDKYSPKLESPNPSGITSEWRNEFSPTLLDTCSSKIPKIV
ncbi:hypothetical protein IFM89_039598 [Coptis chinensis]|uniref:Zinc finger PHD-type domain-containing protein n=1 Tax=Coptis chinensis TaxID=261450 RepID=A0A835GXS1_9MAGN|nr:hypothetical protein IFM89_039598 [Coptis chinensis]